MGKGENLGVRPVGPDIDPSPRVGPDIDPWLRVVVVPPGVLPSVFIVVPVDVDVGTYVILDEKRVTRDLEVNFEKRVFAITNAPAEVWRICYQYRPLEEVYTIEKREKENPSPSPLVWTAPSADEAAHSDQIFLKRFLEPNPFQLFKFERVDVE